MAPHATEIGMIPMLTKTSSALRDRNLVGIESDPRTTVAARSSHGRPNRAIASISRE